MPDASAEALYYNVAMMRLNGQQAQVDTIDARASSIFAIGSTILPITASFASSDRNVLADERTAQIALVIGALFYVALASAFLWSYRLARWDIRPELEQWQGVTIGKREEEMHRWLGDACVEAYQANRPQLNRKNKLVAAAPWCLVLEALALSVAVVIPLF
ncbi:MAG: hypothetical protein ACRDJH_01175 [Thermomicrobiales bacterium]